MEEKPHPHQPSSSGSKDSRDKTANPQPARPRRRVRNLHRWLGLLLILPILWLSITGLLLNHADELGLNTKTVTSPALLNHYKQLPSGNPRGLQIGDRFISEWGTLLFLDQTLLPELSGILTGAAAHRSDLAIATTDRIQLYDSEGTPTDLIDEITLPAIANGGITALATTTSGTLAVQTVNQWWTFDPDLTTATPLDTPPTEVTKPSSLSKAQTDTLRQTLAATAQIPLSRVILDAHSGRLFGSLGKWLTSLSALLLIFLSLSGLKLFPKRKRPKS